VQQSPPSLLHSLEVLDGGEADGTVREFHLGPEVVDDPMDEEGVALSGGIPVLVPKNDQEQCPTRIRIVVANELRPLSESGVSTES
jgi:hypothetical protein